MVEEFFKIIRPIFGGHMNQSQVVGVEAIIEGFAKWGDRRVGTLAYCLGTTWWETAKTMRPIKETFRQSDGAGPDDQTVIRRLDAAFAKGQLKWVKKPYWRDGWFGRGLVQLTHESNYSGRIRDAVFAEFGVDIHKERDLVMRMDIAVFILIKGIINGWFTGKDADDFIDDIDEFDEEDRKEYLGARRIVNGQDRAKEIADASLVFEDAIREQEKNDLEALVHPPAPKEPEPPATSEETYVPTTQLPWWFWPTLVGTVTTAAFAVYFLFLR
jgi:hypothetical protein